MTAISTHGASAEDPDVREAIRCELLLLDAAVRSSRERVLALLHPDFVEFGASGRRWDAVSAAASMKQGAGDEEPVEASAFSGVRLADDVVLLTYEAHRPERVSLRSSVWVRVDGAWRLRFHQGTIAAS